MTTDNRPNIRCKKRNNSMTRDERNNNKPQDRRCTGGFVCVVFFVLIKFTHSLLFIPFTCNLIKTKYNTK